jgi:magnesium transporter
MLTCYIDEGDRLRAASPIEALNDPRLVWLDMHDPDDAQDAAVERCYGIDVPSLAEMMEIEPSSRLYEENGALYMTATLVAQVEAGDPVSAPVTFILAPKGLVTLRHADPKSFRIFAAQVQKSKLADTRPVGVFLSLLETVVARFADILELVSSDTDQISAHVFRSDQQKNQRSLEALLKDIGRCGELNSRVREAVASTIRLLTWFGHPDTGYSTDKLVRERIKTLGRDMSSLGDHANAQANKLQFLLDATLGRINIVQTNIIKIFSVAAAAFLPPTLIASIYGMNFDVMPELHWRFGYPLAIGAMLLSAALPLWYFKRKGWL